MSFELWILHCRFKLLAELWSLHYQFKLLAELKDFCLMKDIFFLVRHSLLIVLKTCNKKKFKYFLFSRILSCFRLHIVK